MAAQGPLPGTLIAVCGPSGAGKDTVLRLARGLLADRPEIVFARRCITRPADEGEDNEALTPEAFRARREAGGFLLHWQANGLEYGLPAALKDVLAGGHCVVANLSRGVLGAARALGFDVVGVEISASPDVLGERLARRGREDAPARDQRLARNALYAAGIGADHVILNDAAPEAAAQRLVALIDDIAPSHAL